LRKSKVIQSDLTTKTPEISSSFNQTQRDTFETKSVSPFGGSFTARNLNQDSQKSMANTASNLMKALKSSTNDLKKQKMLNSFSSLNIHSFIELERIKKPSQVAFITGRLVCLFFSLFKDSQKNIEDELIQWNSIQRYINLHITKYINELTQSIKLKLLVPTDPTNKQLKEQLEVKLIQIRLEYYSGENLKLFKHLQTNKPL
jgi:hypothetical protein